MFIINYMKKLLSQVPDDLKLDFSHHRFQRNNQRILIIALLMLFEQLFYGTIISGRGNNLHIVYLLSALAMLIMSIISGYFYLNKPVRIRTPHKFYELSLAILGMSIALIRMLFFEFDMFRVPTVYIAVLYGVAVIFFISYWQGFILYTALSIAAILLILRYHSGAITTRFIADIASNGIIAWIVSAINYHSFVNIFLNRKEIEIKNMVLRERSIRDELTGLYNRRKINSVLRDVHAHAERYSSDFSVIILDIDHFKTINDTHGHHLGDIVLKQISRILSDNIREVDTCGRWGGEEFLIVCPEADIPQSARIAERLRSMIESFEFHHGGNCDLKFWYRFIQGIPEPGKSAENLRYAFVSG